MAMPSGNAVLSDKMQFQVMGSEIHPQQWFPDERDGFIMWLRGEFAAANAIIDSFIHHLGVVGEQSEYDAVFAAVQQRRCNWTPVLNMQQYFSIADVVNVLQQVAWKRQHQNQQHNRYPNQTKGYSGKEFRRGGSFGFRQGGQRVESVNQWPVSESENWSRDGNVSEKGEKVDGIAEVDNGFAVSDDKKGAGGDSVVKPISNSFPKSSANSGEIISSNFGSGVEEANAKSAANYKESHNVHLDNDSNANQRQTERHNLTSSLKTFEVTEIYEGKKVNLVNGLKLYEELFDGSEVSKFLSLVNDLRAAGKKGQFQGHTCVVLKRPTKGYGREIIQFGNPIPELPIDDENPGGTSNEGKIEPIPALLQDVLERLVSMQVMNVKPDSCVIDIYSEGDYSQPHTWSPSYGRPVCVMFLTECDMAFGRIFAQEHPVCGDYRGSLKLSLPPGSLLTMEGRSSDFTKHAIPSLRKQRILVTFTKLSQPKKTAPSDVQRMSSPAQPPSGHWGPPLNSRPPNRHATGPKHYAPVPSPGPAPPVRPQPQNGMQPVFVPATAVSPAMPFSGPVPLPPGSVWAVTPPRHQQPRLPVPGTGVFLPPPGSGNSSATAPLHGSSITAATDASYSEGKLDGKAQKQECCNGESDEQQQNVDMKVASKPVAAV